MRIFSNGSQYTDWQESNCVRCVNKFDCEIDNALVYAWLDDGTVSQEIATRMGYTSDKYVWQCGEVEWTEEWMNECLEDMAEKLAEEEKCT